MNRIIVIVIAFISITIQSVTAQNLTGDFLKEKIKEKVVILNDYQNMLADKDKSPEVKRHYFEQALNLFVNQGESFSVDTVKYQGASITTKSSLRNKPVKRKIKDFLQGVMDLRYAPADLTAVKIPSLPSQINTNDFVKYGDNQYIYTVLITREFAGFIDGNHVYKDITPYEYTLFFTLNRTIEGAEYVVYLTDIEIDEKDGQKK